MYSNKKNVLQLVALLKAHGVSDIVLSPGSRNSPITHTIAADPFFKAHSVVDERSAGFYALGIIQATGKPAAVCCTSGTAVLNLAPAVAEAFYQELPLLVITADRPEAWIGQMDGQTIPQKGAFNSLVKLSVHIPEIIDHETEWHCNRLINEAILELDRQGKGPVQINVPLSEPLFDYTAEKFPEARQIIRHSFSGALPERLRESFLSHPKKMIIVGQQAHGNNAAALAALAKRPGCVVLGEHLANLDFPELIGNFDPVLHAADDSVQAELSPGLLITLGGHIVSKKIKQLLRRHPAAAHWHISETGAVTDLYQHLTDIVKGDPGQFMQSLAALPPGAESQYAGTWHARSGKLPAPDVPFSDISATGLLLSGLPPGSALHLGNSSSVRHAQLFPLTGRNISILCNRGTSGIEGSLSSAAGYAASFPGPVFSLIGDLSFFYDMNALWNRQVGANMRIMLNNNGGGEIFHALPGLNQSPAIDTFIAAAHATSAKGWAESAGLTYLSASNARELEENLPLFIEGGERPVILEVFTSMDENAAILRNYYRQLK